MPTGKPDVLVRLDSLDEYGSLFTDVSFWRPYALAVCARHGLIEPAGAWSAGVPAGPALRQTGQAAVVRGTLPGTFPTFIVNDRYVIKFFGRLFDGGRSFYVEWRVARLLAFRQARLPGAAAPSTGGRPAGSAPPEPRALGRAATGSPPPDSGAETDSAGDGRLDGAILAPAQLAAGRLRPAAEGWPWPYLIYAYAPGVSIREVYEQVPPAERIKVARQLAGMTRRLHSLHPADGLLDADATSGDAGAGDRLDPDFAGLALPGAPVWPEPYVDFLSRQRASCLDRQRAWGKLPEHLLAQVESFVPAAAVLAAGVEAHLIHADLTGDHLLGLLADGIWTTTALIDFGDAETGDLYYELQALHLDLFQADKRLLQAYLDAYRPPSPEGAGTPGQRFARRALAFGLLHRFGVLGGLFERYPAARQVESLGRLADLIWNGEAPGLDG